MNRPCAVTGDRRDPQMREPHEDQRWAAPSHTSARWGRQVEGMDLLRDGARSALGG
jgi:hypothetical protein